MMFKEIFQKLENAENPVVQVVHQTNASKVIVIAFRKGMILKEHKTDVPAKLLLIKGRVIYKEPILQAELFLYDEIQIPVGVLHSVEAQEDSLCLVFK